VAYNEWPSKGARLLRHGEISEIILDTDSEEARVYSDDSSLESNYDSEAGVSQPQLTTKQPAVTSPAARFRPQTSVVHTYTGGPRGKKDNEASHANDASNPLSVFLLYFAEIIVLLVAETNRYYHDNTDSLDLLNLTLLKPKCLCFWH
jgi:hypothetical protein